MMFELELPAKSPKEAGGTARRPAATARERPDGGFAAALDSSNDPRPGPRAPAGQARAPGRLHASSSEPRRPEPRDRGPAEDIGAPRRTGAPTLRDKSHDPDGGQAAVKPASARVIGDRDEPRPADDDGGGRDIFAEEAKEPLEGEACAAPETTAAAPGATISDLPPPDAGACAQTAQTPPPQIVVAPAPAPPTPLPVEAPAAGEGQAPQAVAAKDAALAPLPLPMPASDKDGEADIGDRPDQADGAGTAASGAASALPDPAPAKSIAAETKAETAVPAAKDADGKAVDASRPDRPEAGLSGLFDGQGQQAGAPAPRVADQPAPATAAGPARLHGRADVPVPWHAVPVEIGLRALAGARSFQIRLHPEDLGRVEVKLDFAKDGGVSAVVTADKPETLTMLQRDARSLERAFEQAGFKSGDTAMQFSLSGDGGRGGERQSHPRQEPEGRQASLPPRGGEEARLSETARLSTRYWSAGPGALNIVI